MNGHAERLRAAVFLAAVFFAVLALVLVVLAVLVLLAVFFAVPVDFLAAGAFLVAAFFAVEVDFFPASALGVAREVARGAALEAVRRSRKDWTSLAPSSPSSSVPSATSSPRDSLASRTLFSSAAIRSSTLPPPLGAGACGASSPEAFAAISSSTASR